MTIRGVDMEEETGFKKVATVDNKFEADVISQSLEQDDIPCMIRSYRDTAYDGIFIPQKGWAAIMVPEEHETRARRIIEQLRRDLDTLSRKKGGHSDLP
jgi:hypothetical protein